MPNLEAFIYVLSSVVEPVSSLDHAGSSPSWQSVEPSRQCLALIANGLIMSVSLTVLCFDEMRLRSVGTRHY
jgi:hypothetical protein